MGIITRSLARFRTDRENWESFKEHFWFVGHDGNALILVQLTYLLFVLWIGPRYMKNRKPFDLRWFVRIYNIFNMYLNFIIIRNLFIISNNFEYFFTCRAIESQSKNMIVESGPNLDLLIISRIIDLLDTVIFVLRKKQNQITFLHIYHHTVVPMSIFITGYLSVNIYCSFPLLTNSAIHFLMYGYYFLATFPSLTPHLWWKKYLTRLQIAQFIIGITYIVISWPLFVLNCPGDKPYGNLFINTISNLIFLYMFLRYYYRTYKEKRRANSIINQNNGKLSLKSR